MGSKRLPSMDYYSHSLEVDGHLLPLSLSPATARPPYGE